MQDLDGVNYSLITNKDGKLAWRKLEIIHPIIYVALVDLITKENNWQILLKRFKDFKKNEKFIRCCSLPIIKEDNDKGTEKGSQITNWWREFELRSLELSLEYSCFLQSDITDCYGSLYTHSIPWALHERDKAKEDRSNNLLGNQIDRIIRNTCSGQTNGIPL